MNAMKLLTQGDGILHHLESDVVEQAEGFSSTEYDSATGQSKYEKEGLERPIRMSMVSGEIQLHSDDVRSHLIRNKEI